ncbi:TolC family protein [Shewanella sp. Actino-trap-3]|uniref:TolC family protein n=1 Tax=Shewanella sp. Actino-trap-3 TaxID=2058331 RepID=UPI000C3298A3|nr:TolC family protein [Shewanella sp. Actino-trap-3]PKG79590.1 TolC family protein [Shewanella sp. Actino-trap-3]|tara:strand:- start:68771 stop:70246 length:1476 start_codon:yes stop_codon:yes gene_type:complete
MNFYDQSRALLGRFNLAKVQLKSLTRRLFSRPTRNLATLVFTGVLTVVSQPLLADEVVALSFAKAWQQVQRVSDSQQAQSAQVARAKGLEEAGEDMDWPSLQLTSSYSLLEKPLALDVAELGIDATSLPPALGQMLGALPSQFAFSEQDIFRTSLKAMWPIYTGGQITAAQGIHKAKVEEKKQQQALATRELFLLLVNRYYGVAVAKATVETNQTLVDSLAVHLDHATKREQQGQIARVEVLNAEVAYNNGKINLASTVRQWEMANIAMARMLKLPSVNLYSALFMLDESPSLPYLSQLTLTQHPALKLLQAKEAQAEGLIDVEKGLYKPKVFLYGNYTLYEDDSTLSHIEPDWMVGVGLTMPLISRDGRSGKVRAAKSALLQARYTKAQTQQDLSLLLDQNYRQLLQAKEESQSLDTSLALAKENLRLRDIAFNQGLSTSIDRVDAEIKLKAVHTQQLAAKYRYLQAYASLMTISGQLDKFINNSNSLEK